MAAATTFDEMRAELALTVVHDPPLSGDHLPHLCAYCGRRMTRRSRASRRGIAGPISQHYQAPTDSTIDHVTAQVSYRGRPHLRPRGRNNVRCCRECNREKGRTKLIVFLLRCKLMRRTLPLAPTVRRIGAPGAPAARAATLDGGAVGRRHVPRFESGPTPACGLEALGGDADLGPRRRSHDLDGDGGSDEEIEDNVDERLVPYRADVRVSWRRRSISLSRSTYDKLVAYALERGEKMATIVERWIDESLGDCTPTLALLTKQRDDARMYAATLWAAACGDVGDTAEMGRQRAWDHYAKRWGATEALRIYGARPSLLRGARGSSSPTARAARG